MTIKPGVATATGAVASANHCPAPNPERSSPASLATMLADSTETAPPFVATMGYVRSLGTSMLAAYCSGKRGLSGRLGYSLRQAMFLTGSP